MPARLSDFGLTSVRDGPKLERKVGRSKYLNGEHLSGCSVFPVSICPLSSSPVSICPIQPDLADVINNGRGRDQLLIDERSPRTARPSVTNARRSHFLSIGRYSCPLADLSTHCYRKGLVVL
ncbi:hypothetical protein ACOMHN_032511 [Nucella lapillus]